MTKKEQREIIRLKYNNKCAYCGEELTKGWHIDELLPVRRGWKWKRDTNGEVILDEMGRKIQENYVMHPERFNIDNQMPSCASCNINKHSDDLEAFRKLIEGFINSLNRDSTQYKIAKRYGLIQETVKPVVFYFESLQKTSN